MSKWGTTLVVAAAALVALPASAAPRPVSARQQVEQTVLTHGRVEMRLLTEPVARLEGPGTALGANAGHMAGTFEDGRWDVRFDDQHAEGMGPRGQVSLTFAAGDHSLRMKGKWNGQRVD